MTTPVFTPISNTYRRINLKVRELTLQLWFACSHRKFYIQHLQGQGRGSVYVRGRGSEYAMGRQGRGSVYLTGSVG